MGKEIVTTLMAIIIVQSLEGFDPAHLQLRDVSSSTSIPNAKPKSAEDVYKEKMCANEPTCDLLTTVSALYREYRYRHCMCDPDCVLYGDCCQDSKYYNKTENSRNHLNFYCNSDTSARVYIRNRCLSSFTDSAVVDKCHIANSSFRSTDRNLVAMVTDPVTNVTYANKYCAKCNRVNSYVSWNVTYNCQTQRYIEPNDELNEKALRSMKFNQTTSNFHANFDDIRLICDQRIIPPRSIQVIHLRGCLPVISSCQNISDEEIVDKCASYMSVVEKNNTRTSYRNKYCAKCNGVPEDETNGCFYITATKRVGFSTDFQVFDKAGGSGACGSNANEAIMEKFSCD